MLDCKIMTSSSLSSIPINVLSSSECYGIWEHETLNPITTKLEVTDIMEFIDPSNTPILPSSSCSSPSSSPSSITTIATSSENNHNSDDHYSNGKVEHQKELQEHHQHHAHQFNHDDSHHHSAYSSHYLTPLPSLIMNGDPYSPAEVQMLESFNCMGSSDSVFHKLTDSFSESYDNFISEEQSSHNQLPSLPPVHHLQSPNDGQQSHHLYSQQHDHSNHHNHNSNNSSNHMLGSNILNNSFQFSEPSLLPHQTHHQHHHTLQHPSSFHSNHEYNVWDDPSCYSGDYRFICKGESPTTSDSVSYTSVDSGIDCSKSSSAESVSTFGEMRNVSPPKRRVGRPPKKDKKLKRLEKKTGRLWEFIRDLLKNPEYCPSLVRWENPEEGHFRFVNSDQVAKLWGRLKGNPRMTYEKLSRAMRYYYKSHVFEPVLGRRLVYKFGYNAVNWRPVNPNFSQKIFC